MGFVLPETGFNALIAGLQGVPVVMVAGDNWICGQEEVMDAFNAMK